ncbi:hypothetical protein H9Q74_014538, partial [Fusarium xylarioides]
MGRLAGKSAVITGAGG